MLATQKSTMPECWSLSKGACCLRQPQRMCRPIDVISSQVLGLGAALLYGTMSMSMAFLNKALLSSYGFHFPFTIMTVQMIFILAVLGILNKLNLIVMPPASIQRCREFLLPSLCYAGNAVLGLFALSGMNIPMYGVVKRLAPLAILVLGAVILNKKARPSRYVVLSIVLMTSGCIIAGYGDLTFNASAYACGLASSITQALYLTLLQRESETMTTPETLQLNSLNTIPVLFICAILKHEFYEIVHFEKGYSPLLCMILLISILLGSLLNYSLFLCTTMNSALTTSVVGISKSVIQTTVGLFTFGGVVLNLSTVLGLMMNLIGGTFYTLTKYRESKEEMSPAKKRDLAIESQKEALILSGDEVKLAEMFESNTHHRLELEKSDREIV